jgi:Probable zinc-ribbon domain/RQC domain
MDNRIEKLSQKDIKAILRAADSIIAQGGRSLLSKILKGSKDKKVLQLELDTCPMYGYFKSEKLDDIMKKVDWMIDHDFLEVEYFGKLPMIVYTKRGWQIESDQYADELIDEWREWVKEGEPVPDMTYLKDRDRGMILLMLKKIKESGNRAFLPFLEAWEKVDYKKVRAEIKEVIHALEQQEGIDGQASQEREVLLKEALEGSAPEDLRLKCWECGERFMFTVGEQKFYKQKGFSLPKRCEDCRRSDDRDGWYL